MEDLGTDMMPAGNPGAGMPPAGEAGTAAMPPTGDPGTRAPDLVPGMHRPTGPGMPPGPGQPPEPRRRSGWRRARKVLLIAVAVVVVLIAAVGATSYLVARHDLSSMRRIHNPFTSIPSSARPPQPTGAAAKDVTFLVGGLDTRAPAPTTGRGAKSSLTGRTDTLMLVHLIAGGRGAYVVSIPRDSWVPIPGHGDGKINWAYVFGGPTLAIRTVEQLTNVRINHFAIIDWDGFRALTNALGGVTVQIPTTTYDPSNRVTWTAGTHHLNGAQALLYVRDRYGLASGDFSREARQQNYLRAMFRQLRNSGNLANVLKAGSILHALSQAVSVDNTLGNGQMMSLVLGMRGLSSGKMLFATAPYLGTGMVDGQSIVRLNQSVGPGFWHAFEYDTLPAYMRAHGLSHLGASTP